MAGDWIKMREDLHEDPAVLYIANKLATRPEHVVGYCHKFWSWVSRQCPNSVTRGVTLDSLGSVLALPGFPQLLVEAGWLEYDESSGIPVITIPNFDRHLSQGAKTRALAAMRKRLVRVPNLSHKQRDKTATREEKRRVEKNSKGTNVPLPPLPPTLDNDEFRKSLNDWLAYKRERRESYRPAGLSTLILTAAKRAETFGVAAVSEAMSRAMSNGWQGWDQASSFGERNGRTEKRPGAGQRYAGG